MRHARRSRKQQVSSRVAPALPLCYTGMSNRGYEVFYMIALLRDYPDRRTTPLRCLLGLAVTCCLVLTGGCPAADRPNTVVVYVSVDQQHSEPVLNAFAEKTGIEVRAVYDTEAVKTSGMVNRLIAERKRPQADVFWSGEFAQTIRLDDEGVLDRYEPAGVDRLPRNIQDPYHAWAGFGGRARIILVNTDLVAPEDYPTGVADLLDEKWPADKVGIALPLFGTTKTHACALYSTWGQDNGREFFAAVRERNVQVLQGNGAVRDAVADGTLVWGLTDTDDAAGALERGAPVAVVFPDQGPEGIGTMVIPNTVALVYAARHPGPGKQLVDYLISPEAEALMVESGWCHMPLFEHDVKPQHLDGSGVKRMQTYLIEVYAELDYVDKDLTEIFLD